LKKLNEVTLNEDKIEKNIHILHLQKYFHPLIITMICECCNIPKAKAKNTKQNIQFSRYIQFMLLITRDNDIKYIEF
jgi:hypothetical protein